MKLAGITAAFTIFYWALVAQSFVQSVLAQMAGPDGTQMGYVLLRQTPNGILIEVNLSGLSEGGHGFHIHENVPVTRIFERLEDTLIRQTQATV